MRAALTNTALMSYIGQSTGKSKGDAEMAADVERPESKLAYLSPLMHNHGSGTCGYWIRSQSGEKMQVLR
jgi:hypothetical protein